MRDDTAARVNLFFGGDVSTRRWLDHCGFISRNLTGITASVVTHSNWSWIRQTGFVNRSAPDEHFVGKLRVLLKVALYSKFYNNTVLYYFDFYYKNENSPDRVEPRGVRCGGRLSCQKRKAGIDGGERGASAP